MTYNGQLYLNYTKEGQRISSYRLPRRVVTPLSQQNPSRCVGKMVHSDAKHGYLTLP